MYDSINGANAVTTLDETSSLRSTTWAVRGLPTLTTLYVAVAAAPLVQIALGATDGSYYRTIGYLFMVFMTLAYAAILAVPLKPLAKLHAVPRYLIITCLAAVPFILYGAYIILATAITFEPF